MEYDDRCPDANELAAFSDGRLDRATREAVARHVLTCGECKDVIATVARARTEIEVETPASNRRWLVHAAGILLAVALGWGGYAIWTSRTSAAGIADLARAAEGKRLVEGRLAGGFAWAPVVVERGEAAKQDLWRIAGVADRIRSEVTTPDPHALGVAHLLLGNLDEAVSRLEEAEGDSPDDPAILSDLAAALIQRGRTPDHAVDLVHALDAAEHAVGIAPDRPEALFNKALALEELGLREAAASAWEKYLAVDSDSAWAGEARKRLERLREVSSVPSWKDDEAAFEEACAAKDVAKIEEIVRRHPQDVAEASMAGLGRWAKLQLAGDPSAGAALDGVGAGAAVLTRVIGDPLVENAVAEIREARGDRLERLALAHRDLVEGRAALDDARAVEAERILTGAAERFASVKSPYGDVAELYLLSSQYYRGTPEEYVRRLSAFTRRVESSPRSVVAARALWLEGLVLGVSGRPFEAVRRLSDAMDRFGALGFAADEVFLQMVEASMWWTLGQNGRAWEGNLAAIRRIGRVRDTRRAQVILSQIASEARIEEYRTGAIVLQRAALAYGAGSSTLADHCDGLVRLARAAADAGRPSVARRVVDDARTVLGSVPDAANRERLAAELSLVESELSLDADPVAAVGSAKRGIRWIGGSGREFEKVDAQRVLATALARCGDDAGAEAAFEAGLQAAENQRDRLGDSTVAATFFDSHWRLAREIVRFELRRGRPERALEMSDRVRAISIAPSASGAEPWASLQVTLRPDQAVICYSVLDDETIAWVVRRESMESRSIPIPERDLERRVRAWRRSIRDGVASEERRLGLGLFSTLVQPMHTSLVGARSIVVVPDGWLHRISWGALTTGADGARWSESVAVAVAPSLRSLLGTRLDLRIRTIRSALVVGNPKFDRNAHPDLERLPGAEREARAIGAGYAESTTLVGDSATPQRMLEALPRVDVVHVAAHAISDPIEPDLSRLVLAPGDGGESTGVLTAREIRGRDLSNLLLVVLAACSSGDGRESKLDGPLSLARPFLEDGARAVLVTLWDLPDDDPSSFMPAVHRYVREGASPMEAVRKAEAECWKDPLADPRVCGGAQLIVNEPLGG